MKIIIAHKGIKRVIDGDGFNICGNKEDLMVIADQILRQMHEGFAFGWVEIRDVEPDQHSGKPNTEPLPWVSGVF